MNSLGKARLRCARHYRTGDSGCAVGSSVYSAQDNPQHAGAVSGATESGADQRRQRSRRRPLAQVTCRTLPHWLQPANPADDEARLARRAERTLDSTLRAKLGIASP